jgi:hypothetical protein
MKRADIVSEPKAIRRKSDSEVESGFEKRTIRLKILLLPFGWGKAILARGFESQQCHHTMQRSERMRDENRVENNDAKMRDIFYHAGGGLLCRRAGGGPSRRRDRY